MIPTNMNNNQGNQPPYPGQQYYGQNPNGYNMQNPQNQYNRQNSYSKKKLPFHLIQCPINLKVQDTDIHVANFNPEIAIVNFQLYCNTNIIFSIFMNARESYHHEKKCTQKLLKLGSNSFERHFKLTASPQDPKENFNVYLEVPINLDKLSEVNGYDDNAVINSERHQVIVRIVSFNILIIFRNPKDILIGL